ncbi:MAG: hypothetical protein IE928_09160 [Gammaproteobacteria bacterium]|nr:hypothetical protein [Gammaproteobacteria bacterium]
MHTKQWLMAAHALNGTGGFENGDMLIRYPRETDDKYAKRKEVAYYVNHMHSACQRFIAHLSKQPPSRATKNKLMEAVIDNCDQRGNHINQFLQDFGVQAKARGCGLILVDMPRFTGDSTADQIAQRNTPYFVSIEPERVTDYAKDKFGAFEYVEFSDVLDINGKQKQVTRRYDRDGWRVFDGSDTYDKGEYTIGACPIVDFGENSGFPSLGSYYQIAGISKRIYNAQSELDEVLRGQTFSILTYQVPENMAAGFDAAAIGSTIGTQNMLVHHGIKPEFTAPDSAPAQTYKEYISSLEERINVISNNVDLGAQQQSGLALSLRFQNMNAELLNFARRLEDFERRLFDMVALWLDVTNDVAIRYPADFNLIDKALEIEVLQNMVSLNAPKSYIVEKMRQIISADLIGMDVGTESAIMSELEDVLHERTA